MTRAVAGWIWASLRAAGWAPLLVLVVHFFVLPLFDVYQRIPTFDVYEHFVGGIAIAYFFWRSFSIPGSSAAVGALTSFGKNVFTLASAGSAAVVWEFSEWVTDRLGWTAAQAGLGDTMLDLFLGIAGGALFLALAQIPVAARDRSRP